MAIHKIVTYPDAVLLRKTAALDAIEERDKILIKDMIDTMYAAKGVGLSANQIGISKRIFVASPDGVRGKELVFVNPQIIRARGSVQAEEGCLSVPGHYEKVKRHKRVVLRARTLEGKTVEVEAEGLLARIFQHETDHLNGFLYIHRLGFFKKRRLLKRCKSSS